MQKRDFESYQKRFKDFEILPKFSETHVFRGTIRHPYRRFSRMPLCEVNVYYVLSVKSLSPDDFLSIFVTMMSTAAVPITAMKINFCQVTLMRMIACFSVKAKKIFHQGYQILFYFVNIF